MSSRTPSRPAPPPSAGTNPGKRPSSTTFSGQPAGRVPQKKQPEPSSWDEMPTVTDQPKVAAPPDMVAGSIDVRTPVRPTKAVPPPAPQPSVSTHLEDDEGRGGRSSGRRLSGTLVKIFKRRREEIGLSLQQVSKLSGIDLAELEKHERGGDDTRVSFDHAVILGRVLGVRPQEMPGLRPREQKGDLPSAVDELRTQLAAAPTLLFEGRGGERLQGDLDRIGTTPAFGVQIGDNTLGEPYGKGTILGFVADVEASPGDVLLLRHRRSKLLALRRLTPPTYNGLAAWQPAYVVADDWVAIGRLVVTLPGRQ